MKEPWQLANDLSMKLEREAKKALEDCPVCPWCGWYVDTKGIDPDGDQKVYVEDYPDIYHYDCYLKWLKTQPQRLVELALETVDDVLVRKVGDK